jgi:hypothetical protein
MSLDKMINLKREYVESFTVAASEDAERAPLRIFSDYYSGYST